MPVTGDHHRAILVITMSDPGDHDGALRAVHIAHAQERAFGMDPVLAYAHMPPAGVWSNEVIDSVKSSWYSMSADAKGGLYISYVDYKARQTKLAHRPAGGNWTTEVVSAGVAADLSMAVDATGVYISSRKHDNGNLELAHRPPGGSWTTTVVDSDSSKGSLVIDKRAGIHISYYKLLDGTDIPTRQLTYAHRPAGGAWSIESVSAAGVHTYSTGGTAIAVDSAGGVHMAYYGPEGDDFKHDFMHAVKRKGKAWIVERIAPGSRSDPYCALVIDASDARHFAYQDNGTVQYAYQADNGKLLTSPIDTYGAGVLSLAVERSGKVHLTYYGGDDPMGTWLKYAHCP